MISILTTVKNGYEFLEECAQSIFLQHCHHGDIEITWDWWIGINGHGATGGPALIEAERIRAAWPQHTIHVVNLRDAVGRVAALNALIAKTKGDWIAVLDCDDIWEQDKLLTQAIALKMDPEIDIIGTWCSYFGDVATGAPTLPSGWIELETVLNSNPLINSSVLMRRELAVWEDRYSLEDYDLWIRAAKAGRRLFSIPHPLVRHRIHQESAFNASGVQNLAGLRAFHRIGVTVVTAYYPVKSKFTVKEYMAWIMDFWPRTRCNLVLYTAPPLVEMFERLFARPSVRIVGLPFSSLSAFTKLSRKVWEATHLLDTEPHTPELYALWYEKKEFVLRTIQSNPFCSDRFVWCDAGIGRIPEFNVLAKTFPQRGLVPSGKMLVLQIDSLNPDQCAKDAWGIPGSFGTSATFGGGILASDAEGWDRWSSAYDAMLMRYYFAGRFIGKDQNIMASMILEQPDLALIVQRPSALGPIAGWFYLLVFLAGMKISSLPLATHT
jgi:glycosyltransferase involved in cell wall biosynthesis